MSISRIAWRVAALFLIPLVAYVAWWFWLSAQARTLVDNWIDQQGQQGRAITFDTLDFGGFPHWVTATATNVHIEDARRGWTLSVPVIDAEARPWAPDVITGNVAGDTRFVARQPNGTAEYVARSLNNWIRFEDGKIDVDVGELDIRGHGDAGEIPGIVINHLTIQSDLPSRRSRVVLENALIPAAAGLPLGQTVGRVAATVTAQGPVPPINVHPETLRAWSQAGGALDLSGVDIQYGDLGVRGEGTIALDRELQPIGAFTANVAGFAEAIEFLIAQNYVRPEEGRAVSAVLAFLSKRPAEGQRREVEVPLSLQDRTLSVGPVRLMTIPPVVWN